MKITRDPPLVVLTMAYPNYALAGFQLGVVDYLLQPITFERFVHAAVKAGDHYRLRQQPAVLEAGGTLPD